MAENRIDIELVDKVAPTIKPRIVGIGEAARQTDKALRQLQSVLNQLKGGAVEKLALAETRLAQAALKLVDANARAALSQQKLSTEMARTAVQTAKAATAEEKLKTATVKTSTAQAQQVTAMSRAELATLRLKSAQDRAAKSANQSNFSFSAMRGKLIGVTAALGSLWAALKIADDFANLENRLRSTGLEGEGLNSVMKRLTESANSTRSSLKGTVELYSRLAVSASELGTTQDELIGFTTSLNQAILLSGATAEEAQAGLIQLSQGMASGVLRGDELRSVLEQLPAVADVIAKSMGVTRGQLRQLGADGKISAQTILQAFKEAGPELGERFASQATTARQALTVLGNKLVEVMGQSGQGFASDAAAGILDIADALTELKPLIDVVAFGLNSFVKVIRVAFLSLQGILTGVIPMMFTYFAQKLNEFSTSVASRLRVAVDIMRYILPEAAGEGLNNAMKKFEGFNSGVKSYLNQLQEDSVDRLTAISEKMAGVYAYQAPKASEDSEAIAKYKEDAEAKRKVVEATKKESSAKKELTETTKTEVAQLTESNYAYSEITYQIDEMFRTLEMTDRQLAIHNALLEYSAKIPQDANAGAMLSVFEKQLNMYYDQKAISDELNAVYADTQGQLEGITAKQTALGMAFNQGLLGQAAYTSQMAALNAQAGELRMTMGDGTWADVFNNSLYSMVATYQGVLPEMQSAFGSFFTSISDGFANSVGRAIVYSEDLGDALQNVAKGAIADFISAMVKMGIQTAITSATQTATTSAALTAQTTASVAAASVTASAWAPAAALVSAASFGANAAPASAGLVSTAALAQSLAVVPGFESGGYTGNAGRSDVAGVVHGREYVFDAASVQRIGVDNLEAMRNGTGSPHQASGGGGNTYVYNYNDQVQGGSQAERESRFTQFKRATASANSDRSSKRAQVAL